MVGILQGDAQLNVHYLAQVHCRDRSTSRNEFARKEHRDDCRNS